MTAVSPAHHTVTPAAPDRSAAPCAAPPAVLRPCTTGRIICSHRVLSTGTPSVIQVSFRRRQPGVEHRHRRFWSAGSSSPPRSRIPTTSLSAYPVSAAASRLPVCSPAAGRMSSAGAAAAGAPAPSRSPPTPADPDRAAPYQ